MLYTNYTEELTGLGLKDILIKSLERGSNLSQYFLNTRITKVSTCSN